MSASDDRDAYDGAIVWNPGALRVVGFTTTGRRGATTIKVELSVTSAWELGDVIRQLAALRDLPQPKAPKP